jgi:hypothetical protein
MISLYTSITDGYITMTAKSPFDHKAITLRMPKELWVFLRQYAFNQETSVTEIILTNLEKYKKKIENKLTHKDI